MNQQVDIYFDKYEKKYEIDTDKYKKYVESVVEYINKDEVQLSITLCNDERIAELNLEWRKKEGPTDVLTFVMDEGMTLPTVEGEPKELGDILISIDSVERNSKDFEIPLEEELKRVSVHGILHLLGFTHPNSDWEGGMLKEQEEILTLMKDIRILK